MTCQQNSVKMKTPCEDLINKGSKFVDFVRFHPHTCTRTEQSLPLVMAAIKVTLVKKEVLNYRLMKIKKQCFMVTLITFIKFYWKLRFRSKAKLEYIKFNCRQ